MTSRIDKTRIRDLLLELVRIDSHSRKERDVALRLEREIRDLGADRILFDDAGEKVGGDTGNLIALFPGTVPEPRPSSCPRTWTPSCPGWVSSRSSTATS